MGSKCPNTHRDGRIVGQVTDVAYRRLVRTPHASSGGPWTGTGTHGSTGARIVVADVAAAYGRARWMPPGRPRTVAPRGGGRHRSSRRSASFERIYDPSVGEDERWYINDHTFVRDDVGHVAPGRHHARRAGRAVRRAAPRARDRAVAARPVDEAAVRAVRPTRRAARRHLWAPHVIAHDGRYWMFYCAGGRPKSEYRIHLATSPDCATWTRHPAQPAGRRRLRGARPDGAAGRRPVGHVLHRDDASRGRRTRRRRGRVRRPRALDRPARSCTATRCQARWPGPTESPFVVRSATAATTCSSGPTGTASSARTRRPVATTAPRTGAPACIVSDDPLRFDLADHVDRRSTRTRPRSSSTSTATGG